MRGIRGAICADDNTQGSIYRATQALLTELMTRNALRVEDIAAAFFTMTPDLDADFPAYAPGRWVGEACRCWARRNRGCPAPCSERFACGYWLRVKASHARHAWAGRPRCGRTWPSRATANGGRSIPLDTAEPARELLVVGLGLIGGSVAAGERRSGLFARVRSFDQDRKTAALALERGLIDGVAVDLKVDAELADMVVLAVPVLAIVRLIEDLGRHLRPGAVVTDVGGTER